VKRSDQAREIVKTVHTYICKQRTMQASNTIDENIIAKRLWCCLKMSL